MHHSPPMLALGLFFVAAGLGFMLWSLRAPKALPPRPKKSELRQQDELNVENVKLRVAGAVARAFGALLIGIS